MRTILALIIVFMHAFTCYQHGWRAPEGFVEIPVYRWIAYTSFAFALEAFVFISGYLFAFQRITLNRGRGISLTISKLKRLILPSVIFSILYFIIFLPYKGFENAVYAIINGCGHLWFLPMLFWCFVGCWLLECVKIGDRWKIAFLVLLNLFFIFSLPLRISKAATYMVYFYGGFMFYKYADRMKSTITKKNLVWSWMIFVLLFVLFRPMCDVLVTDTGQTKWIKLMIIVANHLCQLLYASAGVVAFYASAVYCTQSHQLSPATQKLAACCFGIYLFQQFILQILYYKTGFPTLVGPYWLPWCGFLIAASFSYLLSALLLKSKTGRFFIG